MKHTYEYYNNTMCVQGGWLYAKNGADVLSFSYYKKLCSTGILKTMRRACKGTPALKAWSSIPPKYQAMLVEKFGDPFKEVSQNLLEKMITPDPQVAKYFSQYLKPNGAKLKPTKQRILTTNAEILNAIKLFVAKRKRLSVSIGGVKIQKTWEQISDYVNSLDTDIYKYDLPTSWRRLRENKFKPYIKFGPGTLIHGNVNNDSARKVTAKLENLIISLYCMPEKPYTTTVTDDYLQFLGGAFTLTDLKTGELFEPKDFFNEDDEPVLISESTVWNYINDPSNAPIIAKHRSSAEKYRYAVEPHHHRHAPTFSLSKISMDDRDLPRKMHNGKRLKVYYAYDVTSGCVIGASYSVKKDTKLFIDCMRNMFQFLNRNKFGIPMEVEVEHHLVNTFKNDLMKAQNVFPFVRWCLAGNSQEKWAETGNRIKKLGFEKKNQIGIGRFYAKSEAHRTDSVKVFDEENDTYKFKAYFKEDLIADDLQTIEDLNNSQHPNQKKYKGMTRLGSDKKQGD